MIKDTVSEMLLYNTTNQQNRKKKKLYNNNNKIDERKWVKSFTLNVSLDVTSFWGRNT